MAGGGGGGGTGSAGPLTVPLTGGEMNAGTAMTVTVLVWLPLPITPATREAGSAKVKANAIIAMSV